MYYEINVSKEKQHFFATSDRSLTTEFELVEAMKVFREKFPEDEGYKLSVSHWCKSGKSYSDEDINNMIKGQ